MNQTELEERIARLEEGTLKKKFNLQQQFKHLENQMKPGRIIQSLVKRGLSKIKSRMPSFFSQSTTKK